MTARALLILGMHRSGTSALAGQCASMGVWFGDNLLPARPDNPKGYYEDVEIMLANDRLVTLLFGGWHSPLSWTAAESSFPLGHQRMAEIGNALQERLRPLHAGDRPWAVKDPRLSRLLPIWWPMLGGMGVEAGLVMSIRRPTEVVASLEKRDCLGVTTSRLLWLRHVAEPLLYALEHDLRIAIMPYHALLAAPDALADRLDSIGVHLERNDAAFAEKALRHHVHESELPDGPLSRACETLYRTVQSIPVFERATASDATVDMIRAACEMPLGPYLDSLYAETLGVSSPAQRLFHEQRKAKSQAEARALRRRLRASERELRHCRAELARLRDSS